MATSQLLALCITMFLLSVVASTSAVVPMTKPGCSSHCGDVEIPYPFGITEPGCYIDECFQLLCEYSSGHGKPFLNRTHLEVCEISVADGTVRVTYPITFSNCSSNLNNAVKTFTLEGSPFRFSLENRFTSVSCGGISLMTIDGSPVGGCVSICDRFPYVPIRMLSNNDCYGTNCCQTTIPHNLIYFNTSLMIEKLKVSALTDQDWFMSNSINISPTGEILDPIPVRLEWNLLNYSPPAASNSSSTYCENVTYTLTPVTMATRCFCSDGYQGNPYILQGCQVVCCTLGISFLILVARWLKRVIKKWKQKKSRE